jgi:hypothetical protein
MNVNDIKKMLSEKGMKKTTNNGTLCSINEEGCFIRGKYLGTEIYHDNEDDKDRTNQKFLVENDGDAIAMVGKESDPAPVKAGEYTVFGASGMNSLLEKKAKVGDVVAIIYEGMGSFTPKGTKKKVKTHRYSLMA